jgi:hypothetical protein
MNYYQLENEKIKIRNQLKHCQDERLKRILTHDLHIVEEKQMRLLQEKAHKEELTGSFF